MEPGSIRINKALAHGTGMSRREADAAVEAGRVTVNGSVAVMGQHVRPSDVVSLDGRPVTAVNYQYIVFNKSVGYVCSRRAQGDHPTIYDVLPEAYRPLKPVGRLDRDSSGLLLLTDDGDFAHRMTHPKFAKRKLYEVTLDHDLAPLHQQMIADHGVLLEDGGSKLGLERLSDDHRRTWYVTMHEGRNRQIRRTFAALGYTVTVLHRTEFGGYRLDDLKAGTSLAVAKL
ncbi:MAG TPA: pseudouridine synthase [Candidatus Saccharimonadales bacterium]|jgi:23S rRNA pseudouridine2605 synthase